MNISSTENGMVNHTATLLTSKLQLLYLPLMPANYSCSTCQQTTATLLASKLQLLSDHQHQHLNPQPQTAWAFPALRKYTEGHLVLNRHRNSASVGDMFQQLKWLILRALMLNCPAHHTLQAIYNPVDKHVWDAQTWNQRKGWEREAATACSTILYQCFCWRTDYRNNTLFPHIVRDWNELCPEPVQSPSLGIFILRVSSYPQLTVIILHFHLHHKELNICTWQGKKTSLLLNLNRYNSKDSFQYCAQARQNSGNAWDSVTPSPEHSFHLQPMHALQTQETYICAIICINLAQLTAFSLVSQKI